jgi:hypothetical protein
LTEDKESGSENLTNKRMRVYVRPQNVCEYFIATMDPKDPLKICLYPSVKKAGNVNDNKSVNNGRRKNLRPSQIEQPDDLDNLVLHNYLTFKRRCLNL